MIKRTNALLHPCVLIVDDEFAHPDTARGRSTRALAEEFRARGMEVLEALSYEDGLANVISDASIHCVLLNWSLGRNDTKTHEHATQLLKTLRRRNAKVPVFLLADRKIAGTVTLEVGSLVDEFVWALEDTADFIAGRAVAAMDRYADTLLPPFAAALMKYNREQEYSWAAPGHQGGIAFTKSPVGRVFFDFYGENLFRTDMGIERASLGSLLDHTGPIGEGEKYTARVFGAHRSYSVLNGTSGSNRAVMQACLGDGEIALCDRNCHKSIEQGLAITGGIPVFFAPSRNRYGIIGPIHPDQFAPETIAANIARNPLAKGAANRRPAYSVVTNCTYDGMCYDARAVQDLLDKSVDRVHFDEAWYAYARFNPLYRDRHALRGDPKDHPKEGPTIFATHSTHKLLAALSQASFIHVRDGRRAIEHGRFNEAYCMQSTTSPLYALIAANDVATAMMDGPGGLELTGEAIREAVAFRQALARIQREVAKKGEWFFGPWNAEEVTDPATGKRIPFHEAPADLLCNEPACWVLHPGERWHGFEEIPDGWCMLDPIKAGVLCPGMGTDGTLQETGIPADLVTAYLGYRGIVPSRTTDHMVLFLFSIGVTKGKWGSLLNALIAFKREYDRNAPLHEVLPDIARAGGARYEGLGLKDLGGQMWSRMRESRQGHWQAQAYANMPDPVMTQRMAFGRLMAGEVDLLPLHEMAGRVAAVGVIPYPPGIPIVMPGESLGPEDGPWLTYVRTLQEWGQRFPGFEKEVEGAEVVDGVYQVYCVKP